MQHGIGQAPVLEGEYHLLRLIAPLRDAMLVHQDRTTGRYRLGAQAVRLGAAFLDQVDLQVLARDVLRDLTRSTGGTAQLMDAVRAQRWAADGCVAAPVRDHRGRVIAALGVSGAASPLELLADHVGSAARELSVRLGYRMTQEVHR